MFRQSIDQHDEQGGRRRDRGATMVEYALGVAFVAVVLVSVINYTQSGASQKLSSKGNSIGAPAVETGAPLPSTTTSTTIVPPPATTTTTAPPYSGAITKTCQKGGNKNLCEFTLNPPPTAGAVVVWTIEPTGVGYTSTTSADGFTFDVSFDTEGDRTIKATVDGAVVSPAMSVSCNNGLNCN